MPRPSYCPDPPTGRHSRHINAPGATHRPRVRDLAIDYAVRYGRLDRAVLMQACAEPERFLALYEGTDDPTVHRAIYCVELGNMPQRRLSIEEAIGDLLHSVKALPMAGEGRIWYPHMRDSTPGTEGKSPWLRVCYWEACTPDRLNELPPAHPDLVREPDHVLDWGDLYQDDNGAFRIVGFDAVCENRVQATVLFGTLDIYLHGGPLAVPLHQAVFKIEQGEPAQDARAQPLASLSDGDNARP